MSIARSQFPSTTATIPAQRRTAVMTGVAQMRIEQSPIPTLREGEVLVAIQAVGICGSDIHFFEEGRVGEDIVRPPHVLGHEASGIVIAHASDVDRIANGTRVAIEPSVPCGACRVCGTGRYNLCSKMRYLSAPPTSGALTEYLAVLRDFVFPISEAVSDEAAALLEPLSVVLAAMRRGRIQLGDRILITGAGPIGLLALQVARASGATEITVTDVNPHRLAHAADLGADHLIDPRSQSLADVHPTIDLLVECSGNPDALFDGVHSVRSGGKAVIIGMAPQTAPLPLSIMQANEIELIPSFRVANTYPTAVALAEKKIVDLDRLVTSHFPLDRTQEALQASAEDATALKVVVHPQR
jgi:L-iditol 2-dehydrogenase